MSTLDTILAVKIDPRQAESGAAAAKRAVDSIGTSFIDIAAKAFVVERAFSQLWQAAKRGAQFEETLSRLNRQMGGFHSNAQSMIADLQGISHGTLGVSDAATMASRALSTGLDPNQVNTFTQAAMLLKDVMGTELPQAFDQMVTAAVSGRGQILKNIGIFVDLDEEMAKLAVSTGRTTAQITQQEKAMLTQKAIAGQVEAASKRLTDGMVSNADRLGEIGKTFDNYWLSIQRGASAATVAVFDFGRAVVQTEMAFRDWLNEKGVTALLLGKEAARRPPVTTEFEFVSPRTYGKGTNPVEPPKPMPTALRGGQLEAEFARQDALLQGDLDRTKAFLEAKARLYETDVQLQLRTAEEVVAQKGALLLQELAKTGETLSMQLAKENEFSAQRKKIGFDSTEERISEETRHRDKVVEINQSLLTNAQAFGIQSKKNTAEEAIARNTAETALGERLTAMDISDFQIREAERQKDFDATQTYYQGLADMGVASFASDSEMARKERELLREQLAFKLRITTEEADRMLFLSKAGHVADASEIAGRGDPSLDARAVEGILKSGTAKDILAAERANNDFFAGWSRGLQKYAQDRDSAFGLSADMARRTAQMMEQGFQRFFFDAMEGKFQSFKDVLTGVLDFTKQIISQMMAQMVTVGLVKPGAEALSGWLAGFGSKPTVGAGDFSHTNFFAQRFGGIMPVEHYAGGGITSRPQLALFGEGAQSEAFVPLPDGRTIPVTMRLTGAMPGAGGTGMPTIVNSIKVEIINQVPQADISVQRNPSTQGGREELTILVTKVVNDSIGQGRMDKTLGSRFGMTPGRG